MLKVILHNIKGKMNKYANSFFACITANLWVLYHNFYIFDFATIFCYFFSKKATKRKSDEKRMKNQIKKHQRYQSEMKYLKSV